MLKAFVFYKEGSSSPRKDALAKPFNYRSAEHLLFIQDKTERFKKAQTNLFQHDSKILKALAVGFTFYLGSPLLMFVPSFSISVASFSYASYLLGNRSQQELVRPYRETMNELIEVYRWALGNKVDTWWKLGIPEIQDMILTLGPVARKETIVIWDEKDLHVGSLFSRGREPSSSFKSKVAEFAAGTHMQSLWFPIYGENGNDDLLGMATSYLKEVLKDVKEKYLPAAFAHGLGVGSR